jgi:nitrite reductase/ring-hydroxylating ferredoxin subunit
MEGITMTRTPTAGSAGIRESCGRRLERREFLRRSAAAVAVGVLTAFGADRAVAASLPVRLETTPAHQGGEKSYPVPVEDGVTIDPEDEVILVRLEGRIYALDLLCTHQPVVLEWLDEEDRFECPKHHARFRADGEWSSGREVRSLDRHAIRREADTVIVELDRVFRLDLEPEGWAAASVPV